MKFSIIIPIYNRSKFISSTIDSVLNQTYSNIEIVCVNDCSTDNSLELLSEYQKKDNRIKIINQPKNLGTHMARKTGVQNAIGDYIMFLDCDDALYQNTVNTLCARLTEKPTDILEFAFQGSQSNFSTTPTECKIEDRVILLMNVHKKIPPTLWNKVYNKELLKKAYSNMEDFYATMAEDFYQSIIISYYAKSYYCILDVLYKYSEGTGISLQKNSTAFEIEKKLMFVNNVIKYTKYFFEKNDNFFLPFVKELEIKLFNDMVYNHILGRTQKQDISMALSYLPKFFDNKIINDNKIKIKIYRLKNFIKSIIKTILGYK